MDTAAMKSTKGYGFVLLLLGLPAMGFLTFAVAVNFLFYIFAPPPALRQIIGYVSLAGPLPLWAGAIMLFFPRTQKPGAKLALAGAFIMNVYLVLCYSKLYVSSSEILERILWYGVVPLAVLTLDYTAYRAYLDAKGQSEHKEQAHNTAASS